MTRRYPTATSYDKCVLNNCEKSKIVRGITIELLEEKLRKLEPIRDSAELDLFCNMQKFCCHIIALGPNFPGFGGPPFLNSLAMRQMIPK